MKRKAIQFLQSWGLYRKTSPAPSTVAVHSNRYRLTVEAFEEIREGYWCHCIVLGVRDLVRKVVTHKELREYLGCDEAGFVSLTYYAADSEMSSSYPYFLWLTDNRADLDSYCESIINSREGRTIDRPAVPYQSFLHHVKAA